MPLKIHGFREVIEFRTLKGTQASSLTMLEVSAWAIELQATAPRMPIGSNNISILIKQSLAGDRINHITMDFSRVPGMPRIVRPLPNMLPGVLSAYFCAIDRY
jgi:hypothetical protein